MLNFSDKNKHTVSDAPEVGLGFWKFTVIFQDPCILCTDITAIVNGLVRGITAPESSKALMFVPLPAISLVYSLGGDGACQ